LGAGVDIKLVVLKRVPEESRDNQTDSGLKNSNSIQRGSAWTVFAIMEQLDGVERSLGRREGSWK
jgi:hypothetical protein